MTTIVFGALFGLLCAVFVAAIGFMFIKQRDQFSGAVRDMARGVLAIASAVLAVFGIVMACFTGGIPFFAGWVAGYAAGLGVYFFVRYRVLPRVSR